MNLKQHYNKLYQDSITKIQSDTYEIDRQIDSNTDKRYGITLLLRPDESVNNNIQELLSKFKEIEPKQYFYPSSDIHVTVMSIISCYDGFNLNQINIDDYINLVKESLKGINNFNIKFKGLTASPNCLMIQGFLEDNTLNQIRDNLRANFGNTKLEQSMDKRYTIQTAHATILRLREKLDNKERFLKLIEEYRNYDFGTFKVDTLELVYNDWYQRVGHVNKLHSFTLE